MKTTAELINSLEHTYLSLQTICAQNARKGDLHFNLQTDSLRAYLRNKISEATGEDSQKLQERIEESAYEIAAR